jgi:hypothetical protein
MPSPEMRRELERHGTYAFLALSPIARLVRVLFSDESIDAKDKGWFAAANLVSSFGFHQDDFPERSHRDK